MISQDSSQVTKAHFPSALLPWIAPGTCCCLFLPDQILNSDNFFMKHEMWLYLIYKHCPIENGSGITSGITCNLPVEVSGKIWWYYHW